MDVGTLQDHLQMSCLPSSERATIRPRRATQTDAMAAYAYAKRVAYRIMPEGEKQQKRDERTAQVATNAAQGRVPYGVPHGIVANALRGGPCNSRVCAYGEHLQEVCVSVLV